MFLSYEQYKSTHGYNAAQDAEFVFRHQITWFIVIADHTKARVYARGAFIQISRIVIAFIKVVTYREVSKFLPAQLMISF